MVFFQIRFHSKANLWFEKIWTYFVLLFFSLCINTDAVRGRRWGKGKGWLVIVHEECRKASSIIPSNRKWISYIFCHITSLPANVIFNRPNIFIVITFIESIPTLFANTLVQLFYHILHTHTHTPYPYTKFGCLHK